jgi:hypothetical protein
MLRTLLNAAARRGQGGAEAGLAAAGSRWAAALGPAACAVSGQAAAEASTSSRSSSTNAWDQGGSRGHNTRHRFSGGQWEVLRNQVRVGRGQKGREGETGGFGGFTV